MHTGNGVEELYAHGRGKIALQKAAMRVRGWQWGGWRVRGWQWGGGDSVRCTSLSDFDEKCNEHEVQDDTTVIEIPLTRSKAVYL